MNIHSLAARIGAGYLFIVLVLVAAVLTTIWWVAVLQRTTDELINQHEPTAKASLEVRNGVTLASATLRGLVIAPHEEFGSDLRRVWAENINGPLTRLETLAQVRDAPTAQLNTVKSMIERLERYHGEIQRIAETNQETANRLLIEETGPLAHEIDVLLADIIDQKRSLLRSDYSDMETQINLLGDLEWALLAGGLLIGLVSSVLITRSVTRPVSAAAEVADNIAEGNLDTHVNVSGSLEVEQLGSALINMRDSLKRKNRETDTHGWLSTGQNRLYRVMRGDQDVGELANSIVMFMAEYTGSNIGSLYLMDEGGEELSLLAGYAFYGTDAPASFKKGEGLVGQAALEQKPFSVEEIDEQYIRVRSSTMDAPPRNIYVSPFLFEGRTLGVLELGKFDEFDEPHKEFIRANMEAIAISLNTAIANRTIQQLLEETQQQSEELQQQQEELEQTNEELEEQTQKLKEQQEELESTNEELEEQTQSTLQKNKELEAAGESLELKAKQLEESSQYKTEFLANMSHELRTPLNSLLILANDLVNNSKGNLTEEEVESAQVISKSGQDLLALINDILDLSKVEAGKMDLNITNVNVEEIANEVRRNFAKQAEQKGIALETSVDTLLPDTIRTDKRRLEQIVNNLVSNAVKFTEVGSVNLALQRDAGDQLAITIEDTGIGIPADKQEMIFDAFLQAEGGTSRRYAGTGLGLSISRELATLLGGRITVQSEEKRGSVFTLRLPLEISGEKGRGERVAPARHKVVAEPGRDRFLNYPTIDDDRDNITADDYVILVVEDDDDFARLLAVQARDKGFKQLNAATGEDGLQLAARYHPHATILDMDLPGIDGHMVLAELKSDPDLRHIPVHIISVNEKTLDPIQSGAVSYLTKPVSKEQLDAEFSRIEDFINRKMKNLLIVEDDAATRKAIVKLIGNGDVKCYEADSGREALEFIEKEIIDCVVLDVGLPDMTGFEFIRTLEAFEDKEVPPIIVYTGRELTKAENDELQEHTETIIVKGVKSEERLLDETALFLHRAVRDLPSSKQDIITHLYDEEATLQGKRVLLVDDDMRNVFALSKVLTEKGMEIFKAENGRAALETLENNPGMDFVLMDIMMPEMDGYQCIEEIRKRAQWRSLPIVALTAKAMKEDRQKCIDAGANDYIAKPVNIERLLSLMRVWMSK